MTALQHKRPIANSGWELVREFPLRFGLHRLMFVHQESEMFAFSDVFYGKPDDGEHMYYLIIGRLEEATRNPSTISAFEIQAILPAFGMEMAFRCRFDYADKFPAFVLAPNHEGNIHGI